MFNAAFKGSYIANAGQATPVNDALKVASAYSFDAFDLQQSAMKANAAKYIAKKQEEAKRNFYETVGEAELKSYDTIQKASDDAKAKTRMAGFVSTLGGLAYGTSRYFENKKNRPPAPQEAPTADYSDQIETLEKNNLQIDEQLEELRSKLRGGNSDATDTATASTPSGTSVAINTSQPTSYKFSNFDNLDNQAFDIIKKHESGKFGFDAVNQGGSDGGLSIPQGFYSGAFSGMKQHGGKKLTDLTLGEVMELQRDPGKSVMSDAQWVSSGKLHAAGGYQFIGSTLKDEVTKMGLDLNLKFTPQLQAAIAKSHATRLGGISPSTWVGLKKMTAQEKDIIDQWNSRL